MLLLGTLQSLEFQSKYVNPFTLYRLDGIKIAIL